MRLTTGAGGVVYVVATAPTLVAPAPLMFAATTVNVYVAPLVKPGTVHVNWVVLHDCPPGCAMAV